MRGLLITLVLIAASSLIPAQLAVAQPETDPAQTAREEFRALFAAGRYREALPLAERMVAEADSAAVSSRDLPVALNDLAATQLRLGDFRGAEASYMRSLGLLEHSQGISSLQFLPPLAGLAAVYATQNRHELAVDFYRQALGVHRRALGLFNPDQTRLVEALAEISLAMGDYAGAEAERRYLVQIATRNYAANDPRVVQALFDLARWYESIDRNETARVVYAQIYRIAGKEGGENNPSAIDSLLGIGRTHRLQFVADPKSVGTPYASVDQVTLSRLPGILYPKQRDFNSSKMDRNGQKALNQALSILEKQDDPPPQLLSRTLIELGDWFMTARQYEVALKHYGRAAMILSSTLKEGESNPLHAPRLVVYRPPATSLTHRFKPKSRTLLRQARFTLTVTENGRAQDVVLSDSDMSGMQTFQVQQSFQDALYSPRFEDDKPVATSSVEFIGQWFDLVHPGAPGPEPPPADAR